MRWLVEEHLKTSGRELARRAGIPEAIVNNIIAGKGAKITSLEAVVRAVPGLNGHWLLTGEGPPTLAARPRHTAVESASLGLLALDAAPSLSDSRQPIARAMQEVATEGVLEVRAGRKQRSAKRVARGENKIAKDKAAEQKQRPPRKRASSE